MKLFHTPKKLKVYDIRIILPSENPEIPLDSLIILKKRRNRYPGYNPWRNYDMPFYYDSEGNFWTISGEIKGVRYLYRKLGKMNWASAEYIFQVIPHPTNIRRK